MNKILLVLCLTLINICSWARMYPQTYILSINNNTDHTALIRWNEIERQYAFDLGPKYVVIAPHDTGKIVSKFKGKLRQIGSENWDVILYTSRGPLITQMGLALDWNNCGGNPLAVNWNSTMVEIAKNVECKDHNIANSLQN